MDHRDRAAPAALAGHAPVAQAEDGRPLALALFLDAGDRRGLGRLDVQPVQEVGIEGYAGTGVGLAAHLEAGRIFTGRQDHGLNGQVVFAGEVQVALVVRRAAEDRACAVVHQDEVRDPDRQTPTGVERVSHGQAGVEADLLGGLDLGF